MRNPKKYIYILLISQPFALNTAIASDHGHGTDEQQHATDNKICQGFGPQTPRDIDQLTGSSPRAFTLAPHYQQMNLCNIHFHENAEHKAAAYSIYAGDGHAGYGSGYQCDLSQELSAAELALTQSPICPSKHGDLQPGDTIEVHWVHSTADITPGPTLGSCLSDKIKNPELRVEAQIFTLVNDPKALQFQELDYNNHKTHGYHQAKAIPSNTGAAVIFTGSTTGPKYSEQNCSPSTLPGVFDHNAPNWTSTA